MKNNNTIKSICNKKVEETIDNSFQLIKKQTLNDKP